MQRLVGQHQDRWCSYVVHLYQTILWIITIHTRHNTGISEASLYGLVGVRLYYWEYAVAKRKETVIHVQKEGEAFHYIV